MSIVITSYLHVQSIVSNAVAMLNFMCKTQVFSRQSKCNIFTVHPLKGNENPMKHREQVSLAKNSITDSTP